jgi:hypothetical protein
MEKPAFVCDLLVISGAERPRYKELVQRLREAMAKRIDGAVTPMPVHEPSLCERQMVSPRNARLMSSSCL